MPEIAEVRLNYDLLKKTLLNENLTDVKILSGRYKNRPPARFTEFHAKLPAKVMEITPRGKHIWLKLSNGWIIWIGFGMTGRLTLDSNYPYVRISLNSSKSTVYFSDMRNFATWYFWDTAHENDQLAFEKQLAKFGPDLLENANWKKQQVIEQFRKFDHQQIALALIGHQKLFAGVGNYIRNEGLYASKIYPLALIENIDDNSLYSLFKHMVKIAQTAYQIQKKGAYLANGTPYEEFQQFMKVYNKKQDPEGREIKRMKDKNGRTIHWVPEVQTIGS